MDFNNNISTNFCLIFFIWCNAELIPRVLQFDMNSNVKIYFEICSKANVLPESTKKAKYRRDCTEEKVLG